MKHPLRLLGLVAFLAVWCSSLFAADINIKLTSANGSSTVDFKDSTGTTQATFSSNGGATFNSVPSSSDFRVEGDTKQNLFFVKASTDNIGIGTATPNASCVLDLSSTTGALLVPRITQAAKDTFSDAGMIGYDITNNVFFHCSGGAGCADIPST